MHLTKFSHALHLATIASLAVATPVNVTKHDVISDTALLGACTIPGSTIPTTRLVGDGNPHQNYFHKQLSVRRAFLKQTCSVTWRAAN